MKNDKNTAQKSKPKPTIQHDTNQPTPGILGQIWALFVEHYFGFGGKFLLYTTLFVAFVSIGAIILNKSLDFIINKTSSKTGASLLFKQAENFFQKNEFRKAIKIYSQAIEENPKDSISYNNRGLSYFNLEMLKESISDFNRAIELDPTNPTYYFNRANFHVKKDDKVSAESDFDQALKIHPDFFAARVNRGNLLVQLGRNIEARKDFDIVINNPQAYDDVLIDAYYNRGHMNLMENKLEDAYKDFTFCVEKEPQEFTFYLNRGAVLHRNKTYSAAIEDFNKSLELSRGQKYEKILNARGMSYMHANRTEDSRKDFQKAIKYNANAESYLALGLLEKRLENWNASIEAFTNAIFLEKGFFEAYFNRGNVYFLLKYYKKAILEYTEALKIHPSFAAAYFNRARCFDILKLEQPAKIDFDSAFEIEPSLKSLNITLIEIQ